jgi:hypothetical protein
MKNITFFILALSFTLGAMAQVSISGIVINDSIPLESASVIIKNSIKGIATKSDGTFKIEAKKGDTLSVSYLGYKTKELIVDKPIDLKIQLEEDFSLDEVLIMGYAKQTRIYYKRSCGGYSVNTQQLIIPKEKHKLFPNPSASGIFQLQGLEDYNEVQISVATLLGRTILNKTHQKFDKRITIDLSQFLKDIYIINIIADGERLEPLKAIRN